MTKKIAPGAIVALKEAHSNLYWYKNDLRGFLSNTLENSGLVAAVNWSDYKRNVGNTLVDFMCKREAQYQDDLVRLLTEVSRVDDFSHLERLDGDQTKKGDGWNGRAVKSRIRDQIRSGGRYGWRASIPIPISAWRAGAERRRRLLDTSRRQASF